MVEIEEDNCSFGEGKVGNRDRVLELVEWKGDRDVFVFLRVRGRNCEAREEVKAMRIGLEFVWREM